MPCGKVRAKQLCDIPPEAPQLLVGNVVGVHVDETKQTLGKEMKRERERWGELRWENCVGSTRGWEVRRIGNM